MATDDTDATSILNSVLALAVRLDGVPQTPSRIWNLSDAFTYTVDADNVAQVGVSGAGVGGAELSDATPAAIGTAAAGVAETAARGDHVHAITDATLALAKLVVAPNAGFIGATAGGAYSHRTVAQTRDALFTFADGSGLDVASGAVSVDLTDTGKFTQAGVASKALVLDASQRFVGVAGWTRASANILIETTTSGTVKIAGVGGVQLYNTDANFGVFVTSSAVWLKSDGDVVHVASTGLEWAETSGDIVITQAARTTDAAPTTLTIHPQDSYGSAVTNKVGSDLILGPSKGKGNSSGGGASGGVKVWLGHAGDPLFTDGTTLLGGLGFYSGSTISGSLTRRGILSAFNSSGGLLLRGDVSLSLDSLGGLSLSAVGATGITSGGNCTIGVTGTTAITSTTSHTTTAPVIAEAAATSFTVTSPLIVHSTLAQQASVVSLTSATETATINREHRVGSSVTTINLPAAVVGARLKFYRPVASGSAVLTPNSGGTPDTISCATGEDTVSNANRSVELVCRVADVWDLE